MAERTSRFREKPMPSNLATNPHAAAPMLTSTGKNSPAHKPTAGERQGDHASTKNPVWLHRCLWANPLESASPKPDA